MPRRWMVALGVALLAAGWSGCLDARTDEVGDLPLEPRPSQPGLLEWSTNESGPVILGIHYEAKAGSTCTLKALAQGKADRLGPIWGIVVDPFEAGEGAPRGAHDLVLMTNRKATGFQADATAVVADQRLVDHAVTALGVAGFRERWIIDTNTSFTSPGNGSVWMAAPGIEWHGDPSRDYEEDRESIQELGKESMRIAFGCDDPKTTARLVQGGSALLLGHAPESGTIYADAACSGTSCAYAGAANAVEWRAEAGSRLYGKINPEPAKTIVVDLNHPQGATQWVSDPTTRLGSRGLGDVFFKHHGPAGDYELATSGWSVVFGNIQAMVIDA